MKEQGEVVQKARFESTIQTKIESERMVGSINKLAKTMSTPTVSLTAERKRALRNALSPDDYRQIEEELKTLNSTKDGDKNQGGELNQSLTKSRLQAMKK